MEPTTIQQLGQQQMQREAEQAQQAAATLVSKVEAHYPTVLSVFDSSDITYKIVEQEFVIKHKGALADLRLPLILTISEEGILQYKTKQVSSAALAKLVALWDQRTSLPICALKFATVFLFLVIMLFIYTLILFIGILPSPFLRLICVAILSFMLSIPLYKQIRFELTKLEENKIF